MIQIIQLKGKDRKLYWLLAPLVMDPEVIRANNNYPYKTDDGFVWFIALENKEVVGFIPIESKPPKKALINNYYVKAEGEKREEILSELLSSATTALCSQGDILDSITLIQDQGVFEKFEFASLEKQWKRYVKMRK